MEKNVRNIAGTLIEFLAIKLKTGVNRIEKKVDHYKQLRDLEIEFMQFGIQCYELFSRNKDIPPEVIDYYSSLEERIKEFEAN
ncbi:MAG: hypothetical protein KDD94_12165 [Calditrichaeota bacterium]|nr:hypothetical protein [Calditrichota bacterium]